MTDAHLSWIGSITKTVARDGENKGFLSATELDQWMVLWEKTRSLFRDADRLNVDKNQSWMTAWFQLDAVLKKQR